MQVKELIEKLKKFPENAYVVIGGDIINDVELRKGKLAKGYYGPIFLVRHNGKEQAIVFIANTELSTGEIVNSSK